MALTSAALLVNQSAASARTASFRKNFWLSRLEDRVNILNRGLAGQDTSEKVIGTKTLIYNELRKENLRNPQLAFDKVEAIQGVVTKDLIDDIKNHLDELNDHYIEEYNKYNKEKDLKLIELNKTEEDKARFVELKNSYTNESLENLLTNKNDLDKIIEWENELIQRADPIYKDPEGFRAHFLAPTKKFFGLYLTTFSANLMVLWGFSIALAIALYYDGLRKLLELLGKIVTIKKRHKV